MVRRGEIWWYEPPGLGRRPFLILSRDGTIPLLNQIIAVPALRTIRSIPTEVDLDASDGMPTACVLSLDNVTLVRPVYCTERITRLGPERMNAVCRALGHAVGC